MEKFESFSSRWSIILVGLGMAVGTGNLWRFPRIVAQNGGAAFLIPWMLFLVLWSMPLMIAEFSLGTCLVQWGVALFFLRAFNHSLATASTR